MKTVKVKIGSLVIDPILTAIRHINTVYVSRYRQAYREGANMPYLVVQDGTSRVISGNHRLTALLQEFNDDYEITVEVRKYSSEAEVLKDFAKENATHGNPLDDFTRRKLTSAMISEGVTAIEIASIFNVSVRRVDAYGEGIVQVELKTGEVQNRVAKCGFEPEKVITEEQYIAHEKKDRGFPLGSQVSQLLRWLHNGHITYSQNNKDLLIQLRDAIDEYLKSEKKKKAA